jgi:hypothetical protein
LEAESDWVRVRVLAAVGEAEEAVVEAVGGDRSRCLMIISFSFKPLMMKSFLFMQGV